jgi:phosphatidylglycerol---prolipoprotein diacylglyceryl transferase
MYPDLGFFVKQTFGLDFSGLSIIKMFGLMLASAFLAAGYVLYSELKRKESEGVFKGIEYERMEGEQPNFWAIFGTAIYGFVIGTKFTYIVTNFEDFKLDPAQGLFSPSKVSLISLLCGAVLSALFGYSKYLEMKKTALPVPKKVKYTLMPSERVGDMIIVAAVSGIIGAKLFAISEYMDQFWADPMGTLFSGSGLAFLGGLIGGTIGCVLYARYIRIPVIHLADTAGLAVIMGYGVGRIGCQLSGDADWGIPNPAPTPDWWFLPKWMWSYDYPNNVAQQGKHIAGCVGEFCQQLEVPAYPTPFYETMLCGLIFCILWALRKRIKVPGVLFATFLVLLGIERFLIEYMRHNDLYPVLGFNLSQAQIISLLMMLGGGLWAAWLMFNHNTAATNVVENQKEELSKSVLDK